MRPSASVSHAEIELRRRATTSAITAPSSRGWRAGREAPGGRTRHAATTGASSAGVAPCRTTQSAPASNWSADSARRTARRCRWPRPRASRRGALVAQVAELLGGADGVERAGIADHQGVVAEPGEVGGSPAVRLDEQVAVALEVGREPADGLAQRGLLGDHSSTVASTDQTRTDAGSRPGLSAEPGGRSRPTARAPRR